MLDKYSGFDPFKYFVVYLIFQILFFISVYKLDKNVEPDEEQIQMQY